MVRAADVADVEDVPLGRQVADEQPSTTLGLEAGDLPRPRADGEALVPARPFVVRRPRYDDIERGNGARELRSR